MVKAMRAVFDCPAGVVQTFAEKIEKRSSYELKLDIHYDAADDDTVVSGSKSDVMYLIGEFAANGEDCLKEAWEYEC